MLLGTVSRLWQSRGRDHQGLILRSDVRFSEATHPSLPPALTLFGEKQWQDGSNKHVTVWTRLYGTCEAEDYLHPPPARFLWSWTLLRHICEGLNDSYTCAAPFLACSVHGQPNNMWLRVWHSHLGSEGKSILWDTRMKKETVLSCKACS